jgi:hypothetical protein
VNDLQSVIVTLSISYALIGALLLVVIVYSRLPWPAKAIAVVVTSAFYVVSFVATRDLLGWASVDRLPPSFKLLQARIVDPHTVEGDPGSIYLWVEALDEDNRPSGVPRAYRLAYSDKLAEKTHAAESEIDAAREYILPRTILQTSGGDASTGEFKAAAGAGDGVSFTPLLPPRMPPKDEQ